MKVLSLASAVSALFLINSTASYALDDHLRKSLSGVWQWSHAKGICQDESLNAISFSENGEKMFLLTPTRDDLDRSSFITHTYKIIGQPEEGLRTQLVGESRRTDNGETVLWDVKMISDNEFCWHRSDWAANECTRSLIKC